MGRFWSILFLAVPVLGVGTFVWAMADLWPMQGHWLPANINDHGQVIDNLFIFILVLTGIIFILTNLVLVWVLWKFDTTKSVQPVAFTHGSHTLEVVWTILPAVTLLFIAIYQMNAWADAKMRRPTNVDVTAEITGRQFNWDVRYPGADKEFHTPDDIIRTDGDIHFPANEEVLLVIKSTDVLHSFFLPNLRMKQDVVPGMDQYMWFRALDTGEFDIVCAELCGWGHYKMKGRATFEPREKFDKWLQAKWEEQQTRTITVAASEE